MSLIIPDKVVNNLSKLGTTLDKIQRFIKYLQYFGYLIQDGELSLDDLRDAVIKLQSHAGITVDGEAGPKTLSVMDWPRCGCSESMLEANASSKWGISNLSYFIEARDSDLSAGVWDDLVAQAFNNWSNVCNMKFTRVSNYDSANLIIGIGAGARDNFDGPSGTLAWAYLPSSSNYRGKLQMKFDTGENWVDQSASRGIRLLNVATHEFGHMLGLSHSKVNSALMAPFYARDIVTPQNNDDITRIQNLYGKPIVSTPVPTPTPIPTPTPTPNPTETIIRINGKVDSVLIDGYRVSKID